MAVLQSDIEEPQKPMDIKDIIPSCTTLMYSLSELLCSSDMRHQCHILYRYAIFMPEDEVSRQILMYKSVFMIFMSYIRRGFSLLVGGDMQPYAGEIG